jgi:hypothetical protein
LAGSSPAQAANAAADRHGMRDRKALRMGHSRAVIVPQRGPVRGAAG